MSFIFSILIFSLAALGIVALLRKGKETSRDAQDAEKKSSGETTPSIVSSITEVFSKRKDDFVKARETVAKSRFEMVPLLKIVPVTKNFVGRKNILADILSRIGSGPVLIGLYGKSGVGKTTLAGVLINKLLKRFDEAPIYVDMRGASANPLSPDEAMTRVINLLAPAKKFPENESTLPGLYTALLQRG